MNKKLLFLVLLQSLLFQTKAWADAALDTRRWETQLDAHYATVYSSDGQGSGPDFQKDGFTLNLSGLYLFPLKRGQIGTGIVVKGGSASTVSNASSFSVYHILVGPKFSIGTRRFRAFVEGGFSRTHHNNPDIVSFDVTLSNEQSFNSYFAGGGVDLNIYQTPSWALGLSGAVNYTPVSDKRIDEVNINSKQFHVLASVGPYVRLNF